jgi:hypothetical protein
MAMSPHRSSAKEGPGTLPEHLILLSDGEWAVWKCAGIRAAGFIATPVLELAADSCAASADRLVAAEDEAAEAQEQALDAVNRRLDDLRSRGEWEDKAKVGPLLAAMRNLKAGKTPKEFDGDPSLAKALEDYEKASRRIDEALRIFDREFNEALANTSRKLREVAADERFREAMIWQNRGAYHTAIEPLLRKPGDGGQRGSKQRQYEELVANYLQRYSLKNDTIGFFGPVGWGYFVSEGPAISVEPGDSLIADRRVYFETWCIDSLVESLSKEGRMRDWASPRRVPYLRMEGDLLHMPGARPMRLPAPGKALLKLCEGRLTARQLAREAVKNPETGVSSEEEVFGALRDLSDAGLIIWAFELPIDSHSERLARELIMNIEEDEARARFEAALNELERCRDEVAKSAGDPYRLDSALNDLESTFTRLTKTEATRAAGETYAARTLVYEDCVRDIRVEFGPELLQSLEQPLSLMLASSRWVTHKIAEMYREAFQRVYVDLVKETGSKTVSAVEFWLRAQPMLYGRNDRLIEKVEPIFQDRWSDILSVTEGERRIDYTSRELRLRVDAAFRAPRSGWKTARYNSPDLMIAAASVEDIKAGNCLFVLGEVHLAMNTLGAALFVEQHPDPDEILSAYEADFPEPRLTTISPRSWPYATLRTRQVLASKKDNRLLLSHDCIPTPGIKAVPIGILFIDETDEGLVVRTLDGRIRCDIIEALGDVLSSLAVNSLKILRPEPHTPRITIDRLVVCRETWRREPEDMEFAFEKLDTDRFLEARRWVAGQGIPRFVFVKAPVERKPFFVDFFSPIYVDIFARTIRRQFDDNSSSSTITITEMLPGADQTWLPDALGNRYTSEIRMVAVDLTT